MADLTARFKLIDEMSSKLSQMASIGNNMLSSWQSAGEAASNAMFDIDKAAEGASRGADRAARSMTALDRAASDSSSTADDLAASMDGAADSASGAADQTDYWTDAIGNYDKGAMEAIYTTEELVEMGFKTQDALEAEARAAEKATDAAEDLGDAAEDAGEKQEGMGKKGVDAVTAIGNTLIGAAIAKTLKETAEAAYALDDAFSDAESTIVIATGASDNALRSLTDSMMRVYAVSKTGSLGDTAAAIGEINTRLGYTDRQLETTTGLFLDFTAVVGGDVAGNVKNVTQLMRQWDIEDKNLESTLDKLTYAGQVSGKSVSELSSELINNKAVLDELGFSLDESIALFSQFELNGTQAASVMTGFRTAINNGTISSLEDLHEIFDKITAGEISAADAGDIFGARAGTTIVHAVKNGTFAIDGLVSSLEQAQGTTVKTAEVAQTLGQKWEQAGNNIEAAFTTAIEPTTNKLSSGMADLANRFGDFLNQHPAVTKAITATGVGLGVVTVGVAAAGVASLKAIPAVAAFGTALNTALGPIGWAALAIGAVTAAIGAFVVMSEDAIDVTDDLTYASRAQQDELQALQAEYDSACAEFGDLDERSSTLKYKLDDLTESFEANKQTIGEFASEVDGILDAHNKLIQGFDDGTEAIHNEEVANLALIAKLSDMAASTDQSAASQAAMQTIIDELNGSLNGVNMTYEKLMNNQQGAIKSLRDYAKAQAEQEMRQAKIEEYVALIKQQAAEEEALAKAKAEVEAATEANTAAQEAYQNAVNSVTVYGANGWGAYAQSFTPVGVNARKAADALDVLTDKQSELQDAFDETTNRIAELEEEWGNLSRSGTTFNDAVSDSFANIKDDLDDLCAAYKEAYDAAYSAIDGMFGLFEKADMGDVENNVRGTFGLFEQVSLKADATARQMVDNLKGQTKAYTSYAENLASASDLGIDSRLLESLSDGSEQSMANLQAIISYVNSLGTDSDRAKAYIDSLNEAYSDNQAAQDYFDKASESADAYIENLQSQSEAINLYVENIRKAQDLHLDTDLIASLSDGSKESAAQLQAIIDKVSELGESSDEAQAFINDMNTSFAGVKEAKANFADTVGKMQTDFDEKMGEMEARLAESIEAMNQQADAATAARETIEAYTQAILDGTNSAVAAAKAVAAGVSAALSSGNVTDGDMYYYSQSLPGHAAGTTNAEDVFIAGENGPELVVGAAGSTVFPHEETEKIIQAVAPETPQLPEEPVIDLDATGGMNERIISVTAIHPDVYAGYEVSDYTKALLQSTHPERHYLPELDDRDLIAGGRAEPEDKGGSTDAGRPGAATEDSRHIYLEVNGGGKISISPTTDRAEVLEILEENLRPVLVGIIEQEIFEEGDGSYEF